MTGEVKTNKNSKEIDDDLDDLEEDNSDDTLTLSTRVAVDDDDDDDSTDMSAELNIEELVAKLDKTDDDDLARRRAIKRRLEELREMRDAEKDIDSTYNFNFDDD
tara:strand:- start:2959 stop:3273 length:315 start_codon:yes stop_codon:yes gene_type:complete